ncbi:MAG: ABC transporter ATP-binding protein [Flavobacteriaceae bacterium]
MKRVMLKIENVSKQYRLGLVGTGSLVHDLNRFWHQLRGKEDPYLKVGAVNDRSKKSDEAYVWALQEINFEVMEGEVLGIIGKNGAGKSTLLKLLSRVTGPTTGTIKSRGRIASLLEVGTGFHPELTGRENIFLNGAILGMTKAEIASKIDEIIAFSGCERYIDTPVKRYSSGMTVRLAFAVAAHLEPDILVIDEVLAVGDAEFQKKAIGKMQEISHGQGRTVLFVSHNMASVKKLCTRGLVLENGRIAFTGDIEDCVEHYLKKEDRFSESEGEIQWLPEEAPGTEEFRLRKVQTVSTEGIVQASFLDNQPVTIQVAAEVLQPLRNMRLNFKLFNHKEIVVFTTSSHLSEAVDKAPGVYHYEITIPPLLLNQGTYKINLQAGIPGQRQILLSTKVLSFRVEKITDSGTTYSTVLPGVVAPKIDWKITQQ